MKIVLASASPRRRELLLNAGIEFTVRPAGIPEVRLPGERPDGYVLRIAGAKAAATKSDPGEWVLAADTTVDIDGVALEKPASAADAIDMLRRLSGRWHEVHTGVVLRSETLSLAECVTTRVEFAPIPHAEIASYAASDEPMDKAGGYAIQGIASRWVRRIEGCYFNVVGLPVSTVWRMLAQMESAG
jgi:septum formation protein